MGFEILKQYGARIEFSKAEKIRALMLYNCIKYLPGFNDKKFDNVADAICHVTKEAARLIQHPHGFTSHQDFRQDETIPEEYGLQIIYDEFDPTDGRWGSYCDLDNCTENDKELRKVFYMCMQLIFGFGFTCFEDDGDYCVQSLESWYDWRSERNEEELHELHRQFVDENSRQYNPELDKESTIGLQIEEVVDQADTITTLMEIYQDVAIPMLKRIRKTKINYKLMYRVAEKYKDWDAGQWISHILMLKKQDFHISQYTADAFRDINPIYDEEALRPTSSYGFVFDGDNLYADDVSQDYGEYVNNYCVIPFAINKVIMNNGDVYETPNVPLGYWVKKIFNFSFTKHKDEVDRQSKARSLVDIILD